MIEFLIWTISFLSLFLSIFWINVIYSKEENIKSSSSNPKISILVPALNEEKAIAKTLDSLLGSDYKNLEIIVIDDGSTDNTSSIVKKYSSVILLKNIHKGTGKASALNKGIKHATGELIGVVDADTEIKKDALKNMIHFFDDKTIGAVISAIKIKNVKNIFHKLQRIEYIMATFSRNLMSKIDTLHVTPGALSIYRKNVIEKLGYFDENNLTEDLEIAMRLRYNGYNIKMSPNAFSYTNVPSTFKQLWNQRVRWFRGFIYNTAKYRKMFMSRKHGIMGTFQIPINFVTLIAILFAVLIMAYEIIRQANILINKYIVLNTDLFRVSYDLPTVREIILNTNITLFFPLAIAFILTVFLLHKAHRSSDEKWQISLALLIYFTIYPILRSLHWITAFIKESSQSKKKW